MTKNTFKQRFNGHNATIKKRPTKEKVTTLSEHIWKLKDQKTPFTIKWSIRGNAPPYQNGQKKCLLCIREKTTICLSDPKRLLNNRSEMLSKCIHRAKFELRKFYNPP